MVELNPPYFTRSESSSRQSSTRMSLMKESLLRCSDEAKESTFSASFGALIEDRARVDSRPEPHHRIRPRRRMLAIPVEESILEDDDSADDEYAGSDKGSYAVEGQRPRKKTGWLADILVQATAALFFVYVPGIARKKRIVLGMLVPVGVWLATAYLIGFVAIYIYKFGVAKSSPTVHLYIMTNSTNYIAEVFVNCALFVAFAVTQTMAFLCFVRHGHLPSLCSPVPPSVVGYWWAYLSNAEQISLNRRASLRSLQPEVEDTLSTLAPRKGTKLAIRCWLPLIASFVLILLQVVTMIRQQCFFQTCDLFFFLDSHPVAVEVISYFSVAMVFWSMSASSVFVVVFFLATDRLTKAVEQLSRIVCQPHTNLTDAMLAHERLLAYRSGIVQFFNT